MKVLVNNKNKKFTGLKKAGFTVIELLVVLGIFAVIMGVAMFNQAGLSSNILLTNLAYETALAVREAQTYGIGVRATEGGNFEKGYGVYFDTDTLNQIVVFGDSDGDNTYAGLTELQSLYEIKNQRGNSIKSVCVGSAPNCIKLLDHKKLSIMFKRPNPEATFHIFDINNSLVLPDPVTGPVSIVVGNADGTSCRTVIVEVTGQIRVESPTVGSTCN
jgi:prepilin-type N-terminal cleavage/methylation domain-containing protein